MLMYAEQVPDWEGIVTQVEKGPENIREWEFLCWNGPGRNDLHVDSKDMDLLLPLLYIILPSFWYVFAGHNI